jgi:hypothetical protein
MTVSLRRINPGKGEYRPLDWREFHFFKPLEGIQKSNLLEIRICLDYERARESRSAQAFFDSNDRASLAKSVARAVERRMRWLPIVWEGGESEQEAAENLFVPAACGAAISLFPRPWLSATKEFRRQITGTLAPIYAARPMFSRPFPIDPEEAELLTMAALADNSLLRVIAIDTALPFTKLVEQFKGLLRHVGIRGEESGRGKLKVSSALDDLGCYRLSKLHHTKRSDAMLEADFIRSANKISTAKRRATAALRRLNYLLE